MKRYFGIAILAIAGGALGSLLLSVAPAVAQNVNCYLEQGGSSIVFGTGCTWKIGSTAVTSTAAELNILDGVTSTAAELNLLDGQNAGATPPATCTVGQIFIDTDETDDTNCATTADNSICSCVATNTWASAT